MLHVFHPLLLVALVMLLWEPSDEQLGSHLLCFVARDRHSTPSPPHCLNVVVVQGDTQVHIIIHVFACILHIIYLVSCVHSTIMLMQILL